MRALLVLLVAGCAVGPAPLPATHPATATAPTGRLSGAPATLRPGVTAYDLPKATEPAPEHHHHHGS